MTGVCASAAYFVALAARKIRIATTGKVMIHAPRVTITLAEVEELEASTKAMRRMTRRWVDVVAKRSLFDVATVRRWFSGRDFWFTPHEAEAAGLIDEIFSAKRPDRPLPDEMPESESALDPEPEPNGAELLLAVVKACGIVETRDKAKLFGELSLWFAQNIREMTED